VDGDFEAIVAKTPTSFPGQHS